jgi:hypothetical protein
MFKTKFRSIIKNKNRIVSELTTAKLAISKTNLSFILFELVERGNSLKNKK